MRSVGIDASTARTGLVVLEASGERVPNTVVRRSISFDKLTGVERAQAIVGEIMREVTEAQPGRIVVEGYSLNLKNKSSVVPLVELGGLLRFCLRLDGWSWLDPRAGELKKFVMGKGTGPKDAMMLHVFKRWGFEAGNNDEADAYGLACMGLAHANLLPGATQEMRFVVGGLKLRNN